MRKERLLREGRGKGYQDAMHKEASGAKVRLELNDEIMQDADHRVGIPPWTRNSRGRGVGGDWTQVIVSLTEQLSVFHYQSRVKGGGLLPWQ